MTIFSFDLQVYLALPTTWTNASNGTFTPQGEQLCQMIFKSIYKCRSYGLNKFNFWPFHHLTSSVTLTFYLSEQLFQILLLLKRNSCAKLFWNPCTHVQGIARTNSGGCRHNTPLYPNWNWRSSHAGLTKKHYKKIYGTKYYKRTRSTNIILIYKSSLIKTTIQKIIIILTMNWFHA